MADEPIRLLVVDDSALYRQSICNVLRDAPEVSIVGVARGGVDALEKIEDWDARASEVNERIDSALKNIDQRLDELDW